MHLNSFNHFRAISILLIIAGHSFEITGLKVNSLIDATAKNLIQGNTALFVFISGFLFHHIFYAKFKFQRFMSAKIKNVLVPYLILGFVPICFFIASGKADSNGYFLPTGEGVLFEYIIPALKYYSSGYFLLAYWYIPFIMLVFLMSPLHIRFIHMSSKQQFSLVFVFSTISVLIHRPIDNVSVSVLHSLMYYTPVYLIGIMASINRIYINNILSGKEVWLLVVVIGIAGYQALQGDVGNYHKAAMDYAAFDLMFFQKLVLCFFFMTFLNRFESYNNSYTHTVASTSFTAFFIHPFIIWVLGKIELSALNQNSWLFYFFFVFAVTASCILIAKATKIIVPKYSRNLIGY